MFIRRKKKKVLKKIADWLWPSISLRRAFKYVAHRLGRLPATPYQIACGFACGAAMSFTPFIGLHFVLSALFAMTLRASVIASAIGTVVGNPLTFPFIWALTYETGATVLGINGHDVNVTHMFGETLTVFGEMNRWYFDLITSPTIAIANIDSYLGLWGRVWEIIFPLLVGCIPWVIAVWCLFFFAMRPFFRAYRRASEERRKKKREKKK